jgi:hypothetical protein
MGTIESSIGKVSSEDRGPMKRYVVDDPTAEKENFFAQRDMLIQQQEQRLLNQERNESPTVAFVKKLNEEQFAEHEDLVRETRAKKNVIDPTKKTKLECLLGLRQKYDSINIDGHKVTLKSLSAKATKDIFEKMYKVKSEDELASPIEKMFDMRHLTLVYALYAFDDVKFSDILGEFDDFDTRLSLVEEMSDDAVKDIYSFFEEKIKFKFPTNEVETKELIGDIKK